MSQADELLNGLSNDDVAVYTINSTEEHIAIGDDRVIRIPDALKRLAVQHDHDIETVTFDCPRYWDNHDMSKMKIFINYLLPDGTKGQYPAKNIVAVGRSMSFDWTISNNVTKYNGSISFLVCVVKTDADGNEERHWNSELNQEAYISEGLECKETALHKYPDIITYLLTRMDEVEAIATPEAMQTYTDAWLEENHSRILAEIEAKGAATLATIPADYTETHNMAKESVRTKADAIVCSAEGSVVTVSDSSDDHIRNLRIFGKTTQAADPTPSTPQALTSLGAAGTVGVTVVGKNLIDIHRTDIGKISATATVEGESITVATSVDNTFSRAVIPVTYPINTPLIISFDATILQGLDIMPSHAMPVYMRKGNAVSTHVNLEITASKRSYTIAIPDGLPEAGYSLWLYIKTSAEFIGRVEVKYENIQIEVGSTATEYEMYVDSQTLNANTPNGLPGISVTSGGNYTDANGQQWICDEIDFERGVYIQRVGQMTLSDDSNWYYNTDTVGKEFFYTAENNNAKAWETRLYSSHFPAIGGKVGMESDYWMQFSGSGGIRFRHKDLTSLDKLAAWLPENPVSLCYVLATPIETPLAAEELEAFKALKTNYPNTTVLNDVGAYMELSYNADTKTYVDNGIKQTVTDVLEAIENGSY